MLLIQIQNGSSDEGIMAIENSISGTIHSNFELIKKSGLQIVGEIYLSIQQHLAVLPGTKMEELEQVESHYMAINQCREFFRSHPEMKLVDMEDTALSMKRVAENKNKKIGAIGSSLAAEHYGLEIIAPSIQTNKDNSTRFLLLSKSGRQMENSNKSTLQLSVQKRKRHSLENSDMFERKQY